MKKPREGIEPTSAFTYLLNLFGEQASRASPTYPKNSGIASHATGIICLFATIKKKAVRDINRKGSRYIHLSVFSNCSFSIPVAVSILRLFSVEGVCLKL